MVTPCSPDSDAAFEAWFLKVSSWGLSHEELVNASIRTPGNDPGDVVYTSPSGSAMTRHICSHWINFYGAAKFGWKSSRDEAATPSGRDDELDPIEKIEPLEIEVTGPYLYAGDKHPSLRLAAPDRIVASVYVIDGDDERALAEAYMIKEAFRLGGKEIDRLHYASGVAQPSPVQEALELAVNIIMANEPGHSCAVSNEAVALAAVSVGDTSDEVMKVIRDALAISSTQSEGK